MPRRAAPWFRAERGRWYVTLNGKMAGLPVTDPKDEAAAWQAFRELVEQTKQKALGRPEPLATLVPAYLEAISHKTSEKTRTGYRSYLRRFVAVFGNTAAAQLDAGTVEKDASREDWSDTNRANYLWSVQAFVRWAGRKDFGLTRPAKESRGAEAVITDDVYAKILAHTAGDFYQLMRLLWQVGSRPMESGALTAEMVDWASGTITLRKHKTKRSGKVRILYLNTEALAVLRLQVDKYKSGPLFRGKAGVPLSLMAVVNRMIRLSKKIGHHVTAGCFRHTFATRALARGIPDTHVAALLGHSSTSMVHRHYQHVSANAKLLRDAAEKAAG